MNGASGVAERFRVPPLDIGLTIVGQDATVGGLLALATATMGSVEDHLSSVACRLLGLPAPDSVERIGEEFGAAGIVVRLVWAGRTVVAKHSERGGERELGFFEELALDLEGLPVFLGGEDSQAGCVLLFEEVRGRQGDVLEGCTAREAEDLLACLGRVHRRFLEHPERVVAWPRRRALSVEVVERAGPALAAFRNDYGGPESLLGIPGRASRIDALLATGPQTLVHMDFHLDNVMFTPEPIVLDWQTAAVGPPEIDLARFGMECLTVEQRNLYGAEALRAWTEETGLVPDPARMRAAAEASMLYLACAYADPNFGEELGARAPALRVAGARRMLALLADLTRT